MKISTNSYDAQYGRTAGGVVNMSLKSGTNSFHGEVYDYMRRKALAANSFLLNSRSAPKTDQYIDQYGFSVDGPIFKNKTFFLFTGEKYREGTPAPLFSTVPTPAMRNGDFSGLVDASGNLIRIYDPATGRDVNGVWTRDPFPGNRIPADRINPTARAIMQYYPDPNNVDPGVAPWQQNLEWAEHFNKDLFWNWVGKVDHNFGANDRAFFRWGENERNEIGNRGTNAIRTGPAQGGQLPLWRANRALVGDWVHIFGAGHRVQPARQLHLLPGVELFRLRDRFRFDGVLAGEPRRADAEPGHRRHLPGRHCRSVSDPVARLGAQPEPHLHGSAQRVAEPRQSQHPQRSRPAVDQRLQRELQQLRRQPRVSPGSSRAAHSTAPARSRATPSRRSCWARRAAASWTSTRSRTTSGSSWRPGSRTTGASTTS